MVVGTPSPAASLGSKPSGGFNPIALWPWTILLLALVLIAIAWRFRSWLMGVFENVEVLGKSGADLETELLHHDADPDSEPTDSDAQPPAES